MWGGEESLHWIHSCIAFIWRGGCSRRFQICFACLVVGAAAAAPPFPSMWLLTL